MFEKLLLLMMVDELAPAVRLEPVSRIVTSPAVPALEKLPTIWFPVIVYVLLAGELEERWKKYTVEEVFKAMFLKRLLLISTVGIEALMVRIKVTVLATILV